jgi:LmbE family N-acetylglucosaminyl deacetylase
VLMARRVLVVSPHMDDAALSVGATLAHRAMRGLDTEVVTVFAGPNPVPVSPAARQFHQECGLGDDAVAVRRQEDAEAMAVLGTNPHYLPYLDAIYRRAGDGQWLCRHRRQMFELALSREQALVTEISAALAGLASQIQPELVLTCTGFGNHIDHAVTRAAAQRWATIEKCPFLTWEDLPYMLGRPWPTRPPGRPAQSRPPAKAWERKWAAIRAYPSQISMMWPSGRAWQEKFAWHAAERGSGLPAELLWAHSA